MVLFRPARAGYNEVLTGDELPVYEVPQQLIFYRPVRKIGRLENHHVKEMRNAQSWNKTRHSVRLLQKLTVQLTLKKMQSIQQRAV